MRMNQLSLTVHAVTVTVSHCQHTLNLTVWLLKFRVTKTYICVHFLAQVCICAHIFGIYVHMCVHFWHMCIYVRIFWYICAYVHTFLVHFWHMCAYVHIFWHMCAYVHIF